MESRLLLAADYGDAPDSYGTSILAAGPYHEISGWHLGATRDAEADGVPGPLADSDGADDDGVTFSPLRAGSEASIRVFVTQLPAGNNPNLKLDAWIDFDGDGTFSGALERIATSLPVHPGEQVFSIQVPSWAAQGTTYARFRLSTTGMGLLSPGGNGGLGEVEDYAIEILAPNAGAGEFTEQLLLNGNKGASTLYPVDVDRDGDLDLIANDQSAGRIAIHRNDGQGNFTQQLVSNFSTAKTIAAGDHNGDGLTDLLVVSPSNNGYWLQQAADGTFAAVNLPGVKAAVAADMTRDGRLDVLAAMAYPNAFRIFHNSSTNNVQDVSTGTTLGTAVDAADVDGDGAVDFLGVTAGDNAIAWYEKLEGAPGYARHVISAEAAPVLGASLVDLDGDGDLDVLSFDQEGSIAWFENDGAQTFTRHLIATIAGTVQINRADVDGDGDLDLLVAASDAGAKLLTNDGSQLFAESTLPTSSTVGIQTIAAGDFDGDGILEIAVGGSYPNVNQPPGYLAIIQQRPALDFGDAPASYGTTFAGDGPRHMPTGPMLGATRDSELDGGSPEAEDGDDEYGVIFGTLQIGATSAAAVVNVQNAPAGARLDAWIDVNGDGAFSGDERIAASLAVVEGDNVVTFAIAPGAMAGATYARFRLSSIGGLGPLGGAADGEVEDYAVTIASPAGSGLFEATYHNGNLLANYAITVDFDGDGDVDVVTVGSSARWYRNDGAGNFSEANVSLSGYANPEWFDVVDLDGDGDMDAVGKAGSILYWNENLGNMSFRLQQINYNMAGYLPPKVVDFDRDGDLDFVVAGSNEQGVRLVEQLAPGRFAYRTLFANTPGSSYDRPTAMAVVDADGDGDLDVYLAPDESYLPLALYRNEGGNAFTRTELVSGLDPNYRIQTLTPLDFDGDGDVDLAVAIRNGWFSTPSQATSHTLGWYENLGNGEVVLHHVSPALGDFRQMSVGDVDGDGDFDFIASYVQFGKVVWHENLGGGDYAPRQLTQLGAVIGGSYQIYFGAALGDLDGDGDLDVATTILAPPGLHWIKQLATPTVDYGDAPAPYPVGLSDNGPTHVAVGPRLGDERDAETGADNSADANADGADDDGVTFAPFRVGHLGATVTVNVQNAPAGASLNAWIDFDGDGNWSRAEERIAANVAVVEGENVITFDVPTWAMAGTSYARFRVSTAGGLGYVGAAADGEVEDHAVVISPPVAAAGPFYEGHAMMGSYFSQTPVLTVDLDGDGDYDVIASSMYSPNLSWYENDGTGQFVARALNGVYGGSYTELAATDVDFDGDVDLITRSWSGSATLFLNDGAQAFTQKSIRTWASVLTRNFAIVDIEGDGDLDYFDAGQLVLNLPNGNVTVSTYYQYIYSPSFIADIDRDGSLDSLSGYSRSTTSRIGYSSYLLGEFRFMEPLGNLQTYPNAMSAADLDQDGDLDLLVLSPGGGDNFTWLENDGAMNFATRSIGGTVSAVNSQISTADLDGDGDLDVLASDASYAYWFENDGSETFTRHFIAPSAGPHSLGDMDGDGVLDVVLYDRSTGGTSGGLAWYSLTDRQLSLAVAPATIDEEGTDSIVFTFTRAGNASEETTVPFTVSGDARFGVDYTVSGAASFSTTAGTVIFPAGVTTVEVTITPIDDDVKEFHERVTLAMPPLAGYAMANVVATATIRTGELAGDYDDNGTVDGADFLAWQRSFGLPAEPIGSDADGNRDGEIDGDDLTTWTENFGQTTVVAPPAEPAVAALLAAPEASSLLATTSAQMLNDQPPVTPAVAWYGRAAVGRTPLLQTSTPDLTPTREHRQSLGSRERTADELFGQAANRTNRWDLAPSASVRFLSMTDSAAVDAAFGEEPADDGDWECFEGLSRFAGTHA